MFLDKKHGPNLYSQKILLNLMQLTHWLLILTSVFLYMKLRRYIDTIVRRVTAISTPAVHKDMKKH